MINYRQMIKYSLIAYLLVSSNTALGAQIRSHDKIINGPKDIIEYFLIFKLPNPKDFYFSISGVEEFNTLSFEKRKKLLEPDKNRDVIVDMRNAYLQINFKEELESKLYMTYFVKKGEGNVVAISIYVAGGDCDDYYTDFYEYKNRKWVSIKKDVLPEIKLEQFLHEGTNLPNENCLDYSKINWEFKLPRFGTTVKVQPAPAECYGLCIFEIYKRNMTPNSAKDKDKILKAYCSVINTARNKKTILLKWDKGKGKFSQQIRLSKDKSKQ